MDMSFNKIPRMTVTEVIVDQIKEKILSGDLVPGQQLPPERILAEMLSVGRTSVREAIKALQHMGILEVRSGEGTFLCSNLSLLSDHFKASYLLKHFSVLELVEARTVIEAATAFFAAERSTQQEKEALKEIFLGAANSLENVSDFLNADFLFHQKIAEMSQNSVLLEMFKAMRELTLEENLDVIKKRGQMQSALEYHKEILYAILSDNPSEARKIMLIPLANLKDRIKEICKEHLEERLKGGGDYKGVIH